MSILASRQPRAKRKPRQRFFRVTFTVEQDSYAISRLAPHAEVASRAWRFRKLTGDEACYDVRQTPHGLECDCRGHVRHGHCKHCDTLRAASAVFSLA
jgi:hypothetical protein